MDFPKPSYKDYQWKDRDCHQATGLRGMCLETFARKVHDDVLNVIYLRRVTSMLRVVHRMVKLTPSMGSHNLQARCRDLEALAVRLLPPQRPPHPRRSLRNRLQFLSMTLVMLNRHLPSIPRVPDRKLATTHILHSTKVGGIGSRSFAFLLGHNALTHPSCYAFCSPSASSTPNAFSYTGFGPTQC